MKTSADNRRPLWVDAILLVLAGVLFICMILLGNWQIERMAWKLDLIERVEARAFSEPVPAPLDEVAPEYLRIEIAGVYRHEDSLRVKAVTELGPGQWILTPLQTADHILWVNRGFVPADQTVDILDKPEGLQNIEGLIRHSQSDGTLLETNDPGAGRWVSIDVPAMSEIKSLSSVLPYYIAADHSGGVGGWPRGGLTKVEFRNTHLSYALTWYAMAILFAAAMAFVIWDRKRSTK